MIERRASDSNLLVPAFGCLPPARDDIAAPKERVMHVALRDGREKQPGLARALRSVADGYAEVDWVACEQIGPEAVRSAMRACAAMLRPTLVFLQIQRRSAITPDVIAELRGLCDPDVVIVDWDGDQHHDADSPERAWFRELGAACDTSLVVNTAHPTVYANMSLRNPGYLQIGIDPLLYHPHAIPTPGTPAVVMLASRYAGYSPYKRRQDIVDTLERRYGAGGFGVYGGGWTGPSGHPMLNQDHEAGVYSAATSAISMSIRADLPRYTSDRLFRALASGAYVLVERFPDMAGLGLIDGVNCRAWSGWGELENHLIQAEPRDHEYTRIRHAAADLALALHTWDARMPELLWIVDAVRAMR
jgi:hypothetical protein